MANCEAPCEPPCDRTAVSTVEWEGKPVRVCYGHRKRGLTGKPLNEPLARRTAGGSRVPFSLSVPPQLREAVELEAPRRGMASASEAGHQALALWLATPPAEVLERLGGEKLPEEPPRRRKG